MKSAYTIILLTSFLGIAVFSSLAINHGNGQEHIGCIATTAKGEDCPLSINTILFTIFHLDTIKSFSTAVFNDSYPSSLILLILLILLIGWISYFRVGSDLLVLTTAQYHHRPRETYFFPLRQNLTSWLALHENSPAIFS